jgi:hypothetical protein
LFVKRLLFVLYVKAAGKLCMGVEKKKKKKEENGRTEKRKSHQVQKIFLSLPCFLLCFPPLVCSIFCRKFCNNFFPYYPVFAL